MNNLKQLGVLSKNASGAIKVFQNDSIILQERAVPI